MAQVKVKSKSPFFIIQQFISPLQCEAIVDSLNFMEPNYDVEGNPKPFMRHHEETSEMLFSHTQQLIPKLENYYEGFQYNGTEQFEFLWYPEETSEAVHSENSSFIKKKWVKTKNRDLTGIIFLSDYQNKPNFDSDFEVYGGRLEFPQYNFGFNPERGTLVIFPSDPHFINGISTVYAGDLFLAKFHLASKLPYLHDPSKFPGGYHEWFKDLI